MRSRRGCSPRSHRPPPAPRSWAWGRRCRRWRIGDGYVLIAPAHHHPDLATAISRDSSFIHFLEEALAEYLLLFGEYTYWEHGSAESNGRSSGCIAHAHLNVIPKQPLDNPDASGPLRDWRLLPESAYRPYLLLGGSDRITMVGPDSMVVQHYRKQWANLVGRSDEWDYAVGGDIGPLEETISTYEDGMST